MTSCRCPRQAENWTQRAAEFRVPKDLYCTLSTVGLLVMSWPVVLVIVALMVVASPLPPELTPVRMVAAPVLEELQLTALDGWQVTALLITFQVPGHTRKLLQGDG